MNRAFGEAAVVAEEEVDDRMKPALREVAAVAEAEFDDRMYHPLGVVAVAWSSPMKLPGAGLSQ